MGYIQIKPSFSTNLQVYYTFEHFIIYFVISVRILNLILVSSCRYKIGIKTKPQMIPIIFVIKTLGSNYTKL